MASANASRGRTRLPASGLMFPMRRAVPPKQVHAFNQVFRQAMRDAEGLGPSHGALPLRRVEALLALLFERATEVKALALLEGDEEWSQPKFWALVKDCVAWANKGRVVDAVVYYYVQYLVEGRMAYKEKQANGNPQPKPVNDKPCGEDRFLVALDRWIDWVSAHRTSWLPDAGALRRECGLDPDRKENRAILARERRKQGGGAGRRRQKAVAMDMYRPSGNPQYRQDMPDSMHDAEDVPDHSDRHLRKDMQRSVLIGPHNAVYPWRPCLCLRLKEQVSRHH